MNLRHFFTEHLIERLAQCVGLGNIEHQLGAVIHPDDALLVVHDNDGVLHVLKNGLVRQW